MRIWLFVSILFLLVVWVLILLWHAVGLYQLMRQARQLNPSDFLREAPSLVHRARNHMEGIYWGMLPVFPVVDALTWIPGWGKPLAQIEPLILYGVALSRGADEIFLEIAPALKSLDGQEPSPAWLAQLANSIQGENISARETNRWFAEASIIRQNIHPEWFPERWRTIWMQNEALLLMAEYGGQMFPVLPSILGGEQSRRFLILAQNNEELRATGGFISGIGVLELRGGKIVDFDIADSYAVDNPNVVYPSPPEPMAYYMKAGYWVPRDANWSPDFSTAAQKALELYALSTGEKMDGVVAFDQVFIVNLLEALGPVQLPPSQKKVDSHNVMQWMAEAWAPDSGTTDDAWWGKRKEFMGLLAKAIQRKLSEAGDASTWLKVAQVLLRNVQSGHFMIFLNDGNVQQVLQSLGLDAGVHPGKGDFLMLVDTNMGFNKADALVDRSLVYTVDLRHPERPVARLQVHYQNHALPGIPCQHHAEYRNTYESLRQRCYWNYWRILTPAESQLISSQVPAISAEQLLTQEPYLGEVVVRSGDIAWTEFSGMILVPVASSAEFSLTWQLPSSVIQSSDDGNLYSLRLQKQPGIHSLPVQIIVRFPEKVKVFPIEDGWKKLNEKNEWVGQVEIVESIEELKLLFR